MAARGQAAWKTLQLQARQRSSQLKTTLVLRRPMTGNATAPQKKGWYHSPEWWGAAGAIAGWGMTAAAIYDGMYQTADKINLRLTGVMIIYSSLFCRWAMVVKPRNLLLAACHASNVVAQCNQMRRALVHKTEQGEDEEVNDIMMRGAAAATIGAASFFGGGIVQSAIVAADLGFVSTIAGAAAGPFTVHFWAPMSKWLISGASMMNFDIPTDKVSLPQYTALTLTGAFFSRYALLVTPINYTLCSVNIALFGSSAYHLSRKIYADFIA